MREYILGPKSCPGAKIIKMYALLSQLAFCRDLRLYFDMQMTKGLGGKYTRGLIVQLSKVNLKYTPLSVNMMLMKLQFSF